MDSEPSLPEGIDSILQQPCAFQLDSEASPRRVKDNHLLVLIPATVDGAPFTLNKLGELAKQRFPDNEEGYRFYSSYVRNAVGSKQLPHAPCWLLLTRDVLSGSRNKSYSAQKEMVGRHARVGYRLPHALEAATGILLYHARTGERLLGGVPWTYTRCQELIAYKGNHYPAVVGRFSSEGLDVHGSPSDDYYNGVLCCRKF